MSRRAAQRGADVVAVGVTAKGDTPVVRTEGFRTYCALLDFDLVAFDAWLDALPACPIKSGLSERREQAFQAMIRNEQSTALWHLEFLNERWRQARREAFLVPLARKGKAYSEAQADRASTPRKLDEHDRRRVLALYAERVRNGEKYGAIKALATQLGVDRKTIGTILKDELA